MKVYKIEIIINEGSDEWWEEITEDGKTGCDEVLQFVRNELAETGLVDIEVKLTSFEDK